MLFILELPFQREAILGSRGAWSRGAGEQVIVLLSGGLSRNL